MSSSRRPYQHKVTTLFQDKKSGWDINLYTILSY